MLGLLATKICDRRVEQSAIPGIRTLANQVLFRTNSQLIIVSIVNDAHSAK